MVNDEGLKIDYLKLGIPADFFAHEWNVCIPSTYDDLSRTDCVEFPRVRGDPQALIGWAEVVQKTAHGSFPGHLSEVTQQLEWAGLPIVGKWPSRSSIPFAICTDAGKKQSRWEHPRARRNVLMAIFHSNEANPYPWVKKQLPATGLKLGQSGSSSPTPRQFFRRSQEGQTALSAFTRRSIRRTARVSIPSFASKAANDLQRSPHDQADPAR